MRMLHTSDWHLGKSIHGKYLLEDQRKVLASLEEELEKGYDALLIAGDVYDRSVPPADAVELFSGFLENMARSGVAVVIIPGNHDSPSRLDFASGVLERSGIHFRCRYESSTEPVVIEDGRGGRVDVFALPFVDEAVVRVMHPDEGIRTHQDATRFLVDRIRKARKPDVPSILLAHAYTGREPLTSESERELLVGAQGLVDIDLFGGFDYVALGHLHRPQTASRSNNIRYSGSLMTYSFSEADHSKSSLVLELEKGEIDITAFPHVLPRDFKKVSGSLDDLLVSSEFESVRSSYLSVSLTDTGYLLDIHRKLRERFPHILEIDQPALHTETAAVPGLSREQADDPVELFSLFLDRFGWNDGGEKDLAAELFTDIRKELEKEEGGGV